MRTLRCISVCIVISLLFFSCATTSVSRIDAAQQTDISGYWNDTDVRLICNALIEDCITSPRIERFAQENKRLPVFIIGRFKNDSSEHIDTHYRKEDADRHTQ